jgi:predicted CXXCH cytochrome family protein
MTRQRRLILGACVGLAFLIVLIGTLWALRHDVPRHDAGAATAGADLVDNATCLQCHQAEARAWAQSHHAKAMATATPATVLGDFNGVEFTHKGVASRFFKKAERYYVRTEGPDGKPADFPIAYTFGVDPLQQYLIELPGGKLQALGVAWDVAHKRWFQLQPEETAPPGDLLHWTGRGQNANTMCIGCHTTGFEKRYDAANDTFASRWAELGVSCQSCHGPGAAHVAWAKTRSAVDTKAPRYGLAVDFARLDPHAKVETCAMCHARRAELTGTFDASRPFMDQFLPVTLAPGLYHADGQQDGEVYAFGSFRQSKMYRLGVTCMDCHDAHSGRLKADGNAVCTGCHSPKGDQRFPTAARLFDDPSHHHHPPGSKGAQCVSCHMPAKDYMEVHARPDHSLRIPRPDLSQSLGTPNACTGCHADKPAAWASEAIDRWFGTDWRRHPQFAEAIAFGRAGKPEALAKLRQLTEEPEMPAIARATALDLLRGYGDGGLAAATEALGDPDPAVRRSAVAVLERARPGTRLAQVGPLLSDPVRAVRVEAARVLSSVPAADFEPVLRGRFDAALGEFRAVQEASLDMPGSHLNLAVLAENQGRPTEAVQRYLAALRLDPDFTPAQLNLARLYSTLGQPQDAERILREGIARVPSQGDLHYSLGLLLAEQRRLGDAIAALAEAARLLPDRPRVHYNFALALQQAGRRPDAELALLKAQSLAPGDRSIAYALAVFYSQDRRWFLAIPWAEKLVALDPADPQAQQFLAQLRASAQQNRGR